MKTIETKSAPAAIGPYSQAVKANGLVFTSGQIAINPATGAVEADTIEAQTEQVCNNLSERKHRSLFARLSIFLHHRAKCTSRPALGDTH